MIELPKELKVEDIFCQNFTIKDFQKPKHPKDHTEVHDEAKIKHLLKRRIPHEGDFYPPQFVHAFLVIKLNSLLKKECHINKDFLHGVLHLIHSQKGLKIRLSKTDSEFFAQVLLYSNLHELINLEEAENILHGQCILATTLCLMIKQSEIFMRKAEICFALSFLALRGKNDAFVPQVHEAKNHQGQMKFAEHILSYIQLHQDKHFRHPNGSHLTQDSYSLRCSPQVYGVVYENIENIKSKISEILNKHHFKALQINGMHFQNMNLFSQTQVLKGDFLVCSLNEIGAMAFLRSERILNKYLGKNTLHKQNQDDVSELKAYMERCIHYAADNKLISIPSNIDTMNIGNYQHDVFYTGSKLYQKFTLMMRNLYRIKQLEISTAILGLKNVYDLTKGELFINHTIKHEFQSLCSNVDIYDKGSSIHYLSEVWMPSEFEEVKMLSRTENPLSQKNKIELKAFELSHDYHHHDLGHHSVSSKLHSSSHEHEEDKQNQAISN